jgi:hypothetical protein
MNPAPFVHSALAMTRRLKRRDRCPLACLLDVWKCALFGSAVMSDESPEWHKADMRSEHAQTA